MWQDLRRKGEIGSSYFITSVVSMTDIATPLKYEGKKNGKGKKKKEKVQSQAADCRDTMVQLSSSFCTTVVQPLRLLPFFAHLSSHHREFDISKIISMYNNLMECMVTCKNNNRKAFIIILLTVPTFFPRWDFPRCIPPVATLFQLRHTQTAVYPP